MVPTTTVPNLYQVQPGDTLTAIAQRFGVSVPDLVAANQLSDPDNLAEGQSLVIPPVPPVQLQIEPAEAPAGATFRFRLSGAKPAETITFTIDAPTANYTGPPHLASPDGTVDASYQTSIDHPPGTYTVIATGNQQTTSQGSFKIKPPSADPTTTSP